MQERRKPHKPQGPPPTLTRADLRRISEEATAYGITDAEIEELVFPKFGVKALRHLRSQDVRAACDIIAAEGERRFEIARQQDEVERRERDRLAATKQARELQKRDRIRASRKDWKARCNPDRLARRRRR
jgi:uncharacterized membrane protein YqiK